MKYKKDEYIIYKNKKYKILDIDNKTVIDDVLYSIDIDHYIGPAWIYEKDIDHEKTKALKETITINTKKNKHEQSDQKVKYNLAAEDLEIILSLISEKIKRIQEQQTLLQNFNCCITHVKEISDKEINKLEELEQKIEKQLHQQQLLKNKKVMP